MLRMMEGNGEKKERPKSSNWTLSFQDQISAISEQDVKGNFIQ